MAGLVKFWSSGNSGEKSSLRKWYDNVTENSHMARAKHHLTVTGEAVRAGGESIVVGAALGAAHSTLPHGLDLPVAGGKASLPIDGIAAIVGLGGSVMMGPGEAVGTDLRNSGAAAASIFAFRKSAEWVTKKRALAGLPTGAKIAGEFGYTPTFGADDEDPVVKAARNL